MIGSRNFRLLVMQNHVSLQALQQKCIAVYGQVDQVRLLKIVNSVHAVWIVVNHQELPFIVSKKSR